MAVEAFAEVFVDELKAAVDGLPDLHAFLLEIVPLARLEMFRYGYTGKQRVIDFKTESITVRYLEGHALKGMEEAIGEVEVALEGSTWRVDSIDFD